MLIMTCTLDNVNSFKLWTPKRDLEYEKKRMEDAGYRVSFMRQSSARPLSDRVKDKWRREYQEARVIRHRNAVYHAWAKIPEDMKNDYNYVVNAVACKKMSRRYIKFSQKARQTKTFRPNLP